MGTFAADSHVSQNGTLNQGPTALKHQRGPSAHRLSPTKASSTWNAAHCAHQRCGTSWRSTAGHLMCAGHRRCLMWYGLTTSLHRWRRQAAPGQWQARRIPSSSSALHPVMPQRSGRLELCSSCQAARTGRSEQAVAAMLPVRRKMCSGRAEDGRDAAGGLAPYVSTS